MRKPKRIKDNKINNRFTDVAKVVIEIDGKVFKSYPLDMASDGPDYAASIVKQYKPQLKGKNWQCYISLLHF